MHATEEIERSNPRPRWGWLYGIAVVLGGLLTVVEVAIPDGLARRTLEFSVGFAMLGAIAFWVRVNRVALALANEEPPNRPVRGCPSRSAR